MSNTRHSFVVEGACGGVRLDALVARLIPSLSRSRAAVLIREGQVLVNGRRVKPSHAVRVGDNVDVDIPPPADSRVLPEDIPLDVIYEDRDIIVVSKPAGMVVHPAAGHAQGTLVNALLSHCRDLSGIGGELRAGIVHRLDAGTSGAIVAAKNDEAHRALSSQFKARAVKKIYGALVYGLMGARTGSFDAPLGRSAGHRKKFSSRTKKGRGALTEWRVLEEFFEALSWVEVVLKTGRTHQIRVHFAEGHHPLVGDPLYGGESKSKRLKDAGLREAVEGFTRPALHAWKLGIAHPVTGKRMEFQAPLPDDIVELLEELRKMSFPRM